jgi:hypothetical protein
MDLSTVKILAPGEIEHTTKIVEDLGPTIEANRNMRIANELRARGWTDGRNFKMNARIPTSIVWACEHGNGCPCHNRKFNLSERSEYKDFLLMHPEYVIAPVDTGRAGNIIIKGE